MKHDYKNSEGGDTAEKENINSLLENGYNLKGGEYERERFYGQQFF